VTDNIPNVPTITIGQVAVIVRSAYMSCVNGNQQVPSFEGDPGIGKTAVIGQVAEDLGIGFVDVSAPLLDPSTSAGVPTPVKEGNEHVLHWAIDSRWPREHTHGERGILFLDEFWSASPFVKNALSGLIHGGQMGSYTLPKGWMIVVAGNLMTNKAGVTQTGSHIKSRLERYRVTTAFNAVKKYWTDRGLNIKVLAFLDQHGDKLSTFSLMPSFTPQPVAGKRQPTSSTARPTLMLPSFGCRQRSGCRTQTRSSPTSTAWTTCLSAAKSLTTQAAHVWLMTRAMPTHCCLVWLPTVGQGMQMRSSHTSNATRRSFKRLSYRRRK
jgi:hypothetical protein